MSQTSQPKPGASGIRPAQSRLAHDRALRGLLRSVQSLNAGSDLAEGLGRVAEQLRGIVDFASLAVLLLDDFGGELRFAFAEGFSREVVEHWRFGIGQGIVGSAAERKGTLVVDDVLSEPRYIAASADVRSEVAIPLFVEDRVIGVLDVGSQEAGAFAGDTLELLELLADQLASAIESARIQQRMREQARSLSLLHEISREMTAILNRRELLRKVADRLGRIVDYDVFSIFLWEETKQHLEPFFSVFEDGRPVRSLEPVALGQGICGTAAALRQPIRVPNVDLDPRYARCNTELRVRSELVVPLVFKDRMIGVIDLESASYNAFSNRHQQLLSTLATSLAIALENARLYEKLRQDELRLEQDLSTAREVQKQLLPKTMLAIEGIDIGVAYEPARYLGGDFYDSFPYGEGRLAFAVGDVAGKGTSAALLGSLAVGTLREFATGKCLPPAEVLEEMNRKLIRLGFDSRFVALAFGVYDRDRRRLTIANSGLPYPLLVRKSAVTPIEASGVPLGLLGERSYRQHEIDLKAGDVIVLASDGVDESLNGRDQEFGSERLHGTLERLAGVSAEDLARGVLESVRAFSRGVEISDDRTIVALKIA